LPKYATTLRETGDVLMFGLFLDLFHTPM